MCIIIDANALPSVLKREPELCPVFNWINEGKGKIVYGGTKYKEELKKCQNTKRYWLK